jgi:uncharacterized membrane protein
LFYLLQEGTRALVRTPAETGVKPNVVNLVLWLKLAVETVGAVIIGLGVFTSIYRFARALIPPQFERYNEIRLSLARYLALALEFQLGADILSTAIAPSWEQIGKLGAIAVIRTGLNYFLSREMQEERHGVGAGSGVADGVNDRAAETRVDASGRRG